MQFNSFVFILMFLPITVLAYFLANKWKPVLGKLVLAVASVVFYAYSDWTLFTVLGISLVVNLAFAWALQRLQSRRRLLLIVPVLINVGLLLYFKYTNFLIGTVNQFAGTVWAVRDLVQPLGISFFTFQQIAYLVSVCKGEIGRVAPLDYLCYILYFPKIRTEYDSIEGTIKLYNNQVFIADNIKEVIPEFLLLLKGVIDCPDLPLNVSRSALQNDGFVKKISEYITKKVADKLTGMCKTDRESYEKYWDDISPFIKFGCIKDAKFGEKMNDYILFKNLDGKYLTLKDCIEENKKEETKAVEEEKTEEKASEGSQNEEPEKTVIYYVTDEVQQSQYINMFREAGKDAVLLKHVIDSQFISHLEQQDQTIQFKRIDADLTEELREDGEADEATVKTLTEVFRKNLGKDKLEVKVEKLKNEGTAAMITLPEESRRMQDMMKMYNMYGMDPNMFGGQEVLVLNANHPLVRFIAENQGSEYVPVICEQLYDLALLAHGTLTPERMTKFIARSNEIMMMMAE